MPIQNGLLNICSVLILSNVASADDTPIGLIPSLSGKDTSSLGGVQPYGVAIGGWYQLQHR
jgi:hypothetical protein